VSDGDPANDTGGLELLPRLPMGLLLTRRLTLTDADGRVFSLAAVHVAGTAYRSIPQSPRLSDPCRPDCPQGQGTTATCKAGLPGSP
jgi:hypothetical protein